MSYLVNSLNQFWVRVTLLSVGYFLAAKIGVYATFSEQAIAILWPPNALLLAVLLLSPNKDWLKYALAVIPAEIAADLSHFNLWQSLGFSFINIFECLLSAWLLQKLSGQSFNFNNLKNIALFGLVAMGIASSAAAVMGATIYSWTSELDIHYFTFWRIWWFGDGLALLILLPVLLIWIKEPLQLRVTQANSVSWLVLLTLITGVSIWVFSQYQLLNNDFPLSPMILLPFVIWSAVGFGLHGASISNLLIAMISIYFTVNEQGPFTHQHAEQAILVLQEYLAFLAFSSLALAALLQEIKLKNQQLQFYRQAFDSLDEGVMITDNSEQSIITYANASLARISGYAVHEMIGLSPAFLKGKETSDEQLAVIKQAVSKQQNIKLLLKNHHRSGAVFWNNLTISPVHNEQHQVTHFVGIVQDVTANIEQQTRLQITKDALDQLNKELEQKVEARTRELRLANEQLKVIADTDGLTAILNRRAYVNMAEEWIVSRAYTSLYWYAFDLDFFKQINDVHGHAVGDLVLINFCRCIEHVIPNQSLFARWGGEEFVLLVAELSEIEAAQLALTMHAHLEQIQIETMTASPLQITVSIGYTKIKPLDSLDSVMRRADKALYEAKARGRNCSVSD